MQMIEQLSKLSSRLQAVLESPAPSSALNKPASPARARRLGNGVLQRAVVGVLTEAREPMHLAAIHTAVEHLIGQRVSRESVSWCLRMDVKGERRHFERVSYGVYRLRV
jgi:hypothetical protein